MSADTLPSDRLFQISEFAQARIDSEPAMAELTPAELLSLVNEVETLRSTNRRLTDSIAALEKLRPHWAQGHTSDSIAAQVNLAATVGMWEALGVSDQTEAMQRIRDLIALEQEATPAPGR